MHRTLCLLPFVTALSLTCSPTAEADPSLVDKVASQLVSALPGYDVTVVDQLTIKVAKSSQPTSDRVQINLDRVADYCTRTPDGCADIVSDFILKTAALVKAHEFAPTSLSLRAVVRPATYFGEINSLVGKKGDELISAPFAGDLVMMCYFDMPTAMRPALRSDLIKIGLSRERALETCLNNTRAELEALPATPPRAGGPETGAIGYLNGDPYESSYLLLHDEWAQIAEKLGGHLLVAAPDSAVILYGGEAGPASLDALSTMAKKAYSEASRPISTNVFRWTPTGWEVAVH